MLINKAVLGRLPKEMQVQALETALAALKEGKQYTLYGKRKGVAISTHSTLAEAQADIRNYSVYPRVTTETIAYNRILRSLGITA